LSKKSKDIKLQNSKIPRVKICCIKNIEEAKLAIRYGASALGLVSKMPSGPGVIEEEEIKKIAGIIPPGISSFLLTSRQDTKSIIDQQRRLRVNTIQICDYIISGSYEELRAELPGISIVQVIHVTGESSIQDALSISQFVDAILLDSGNQSLPVKVLGGTGKTHDWAISTKIREVLNIPIFLAGGLNPDNVTEAIQSVGPFGIDVCSGVRTDGKLDENKLSEFFKRIGCCYSIR
jgi:phosphoribosylanthranilate isomerase